MTWNIPVLEARAQAAKRVMKSWREKEGLE